MKLRWSHFISSSLLYTQTYVNIYVGMPHTFVELFNGIVWLSPARIVPQLGPF